MDFRALAVLLVSVVAISVNAELVAVVQIFRHGHRTPAISFTNDPYQDESYWDGLSRAQLTKFGTWQQFSLGQFTRRRYRNFLPSNYNKSVIFAQTTNVNRTYKSAQANMYGIFSASDSKQWRKHVDWQAIPIHLANSTIFGPSFCASACPAYLEELVKVVDDKKHELDEKYTNLYWYLTKYSGDNITNFIETTRVWDSLKSEDTASLKLPKWSRNVYPEPLRTLAGVFYGLYSQTINLQRLVSGPFLNEIVKYLDSMAGDAAPTEKFLIYSGHDSNIVSILNGFGAYDPPYPPAYASSIYIELHNKNDESIVKVFSKDGNSFKQISVRGCDVDCPLAEFRERLSDIIVDADTRDAECSLSSLGRKFSDTVLDTLDEFGKKLCFH